MSWRTPILSGATRSTWQGPWERREAARSTEVVSSPMGENKPPAVSTKRASQEVAWRMGYLDDDELADRARGLRKSGYGQYLLDVLRREGGRRR